MHGFLFTAKKESRKQKEKKKKKNLFLIESIPKKQNVNSQHSEQVVVTLGSCCEINQFDVFYAQEFLSYALFQILSGKYNFFCEYILCWDYN